MILILIAIIAAVALASVLFKYANDSYGPGGMLAAVLGLALSVATGFAAIAYAFAGWSWFASEYRAGIINREYGTTYTAAEVFWASNVIDTIRELDRRRIEVNGDVMRDKPDDEQSP